MPEAPLIPTMILRMVAPENRTRTVAGPAAGAEEQARLVA
jgi:hypothetical protein